MAKISIVIPIYNSEKYLQQCVKSILKQSYGDFELLLVNDGSTDTSETICQCLVNEDCRVKYYYKENGGVSSARNYGIQMSSSPYIVFVDSDDVLHGRMLEILVSGMGKSDFAMCGYEILDDNKQTLLYQYRCPEFCDNTKKFAESIENYLNPPFLLGPCFKMFKRNIIIENNIVFPPDISYGEDAIFVMNYLMFVETVKCESYIGYTYRQHSLESLSRKFLIEKIDINARISRLIYEFMQKNECEDSQEIYQARLFDNLVSYTHELMRTSLSYQQKKQLFYQKKGQCFFNKLYGNRVSQWVVFLAAKYRFAFFILLLFKLK